MKRYCQTLTLVDDEAMIAYVSQFQGCAADARSDEKWQLMEKVF